MQSNFVAFPGKLFVHFTYSVVGFSFQFCCLAALFLDYKYVHASAWLWTPQIRMYNWLADAIAIIIFPCTRRRQLSSIRPSIHMHHRQVALNWSEPNYNLAEENFPSCPSICYSARTWAHIIKPFRLLLGT